MLERVLLFVVWTLLGGALSFGALYFLDEFGLALIIALVIVGLPMRTIHAQARAEILGLAAGPGILFALVGETDDAPGLVLIGGAILAATAAAYLGLRRQQSASAV